MKENHTTPATTGKTPFNWKQQLPNFIFIAVVLLVTVGYLFWCIYSASDNLEDYEASGHVIPQMSHWGYLIPAVLVVAASVLCEAVSLYLLIRRSGFKRNVAQCYVYASADQYFSAITPSASGGQPASAFYMTKSGIPLYASSAVLLLNVTVYTLALELLAGLAFWLRPEYFAGFGRMSQTMVIFGMGFHGIFILICLAFMFSKKLVYLLGDLVIALLCKIHVFKDKEAKKQAYRTAVENYKACFSIVKKHFSTLILVLLLNLLQRFLLSMVPVFIFKSYGLSDFSFVDVFSMQLYCLVGSSGLPVPGAIGVSELLTEAMYKLFIPNNQVLCTLTMLLTRVIGAYLPIVGCGAITIIHHIRHIGRLTSDGSDPGKKEIPENNSDKG